MKKHYCIRGCGKTVSRNGKNCRSCAQIGRKIPNKNMPLRRKDLNIEEIKGLYLKSGKSVHNIAKIFFCSDQTIYKRLELGGVSLDGKTRTPKKLYYCIDCGKIISSNNSKRCKKCHYKNISGSKNVGFLGGVSADYYRRISLEKLKQECHRCGTHKNLCVHHKDRNRRNNNISNLQMLCKSCHSKEHNRSKNFGKRNKISDMRKIIDKLLIKYSGNREVCDDLINIKKIKLSNVLKSYHG